MNTAYDAGRKILRNHRLYGQDLTRALIREIERLRTTYAPPALEVIDGTLRDKSQDADWLRARYFEQSKRIEVLEDGLRMLQHPPQPKTPTKSLALRKWRYVLFGEPI